MTLQFFETVGQAQESWFDRIWVFDERDETHEIGETEERKGFFDRIESSFPGGAGEKI